MNQTNSTDNQQTPEIILEAVPETVFDTIPAKTLKSYEYEFKKSDNNTYNNSIKELLEQYVSLDNPHVLLEYVDKCIYGYYQNGIVKYIQFSDGGQIWQEMSPLMLKQLRIEMALFHAREQFLVISSGHLPTMILIVSETEINIYEKVICEIKLIKCYTSTDANYPVGRVICDKCGKFVTSDNGCLNENEPFFWNAADISNDYCSNCYNELD